MIIGKFRVPFFKEQSAVMKSFLHMHVPLLQKPFPLHSLGHNEFPISWGGAKFPLASFFQYLFFLRRVISSHMSAIDSVADWIARL